MKKLSLAFILILYAIAALSQVIESESQIQSVTVYMNGAEIHRFANTQLKKGKNTIVFNGLSPNMNANSITITALPDNINILSVSSRTNYLLQNNDNQNIQSIKDSIESLKDKIQILDNRTETLLKEKELLFKDGAIGGKSEQVAQISQAAEFFRERYNNINDLLYQLDKERTKHNLRVTTMTMELEELNATYNPARSQISIVVNSEVAQKAEFLLNYIVSGTGWEPYYDIRVENVEKPISLLYKAKIFNATGTDWNDVKLKLSTANPDMGAEKPTLEKWTLNYLDDIYDEGYGNVSYSQRSDAQNFTGKVGEVNFAEREVAELSAEFDIETPYTIPADSKPYTVEVRNYTLDAKYLHFAIPKLDSDAFLLAKIAGWNQLNLASGNASIYFNTTYLGQSFISTNNISDSLRVSLGRDKKIQIKRTQKVEKSKQFIIGTSIKEDYTFEIFIKNNREVPIEIEIQDQIPVSNESDIDVTIQQIAGAYYNEFDGSLLWKLNLLAGEIKTLEISYSIKYPKNKANQLKYKQQRRRAVPCPTF